jgi:hypothetical protein
MQVLKLGSKCESETGETTIDSSTQYANVLKQISNEQIGRSTKLAETNPATTTTTPLPSTTRRTTFPISSWTSRSEQVIVQNPTTSWRLSTTVSTTKSSTLPEITRLIESQSEAPKSTSKRTEILKLLREKRN